MGAGVLAVLYPVALGERNRTLHAPAPCLLNHGHTVSSFICLHGYSTQASVGRKFPRPLSYFREVAALQTTKVTSCQDQILHLRKQQFFLIVGDEDGVLIAEVQTS